MSKALRQGLNVRHLVTDSSAGLHLTLASERHQKHFSAGPSEKYDRRGKVAYNDGAGSDVRNLKIREGTLELGDHASESLGKHPEKPQIVRRRSAAAGRRPRRATRPTARRLSRSRLRPPRLLAYVDAVARHGSIRKAAEFLNVASSALNRQILDLEADWVRRCLSGCRAASA